MKTTQQCFIAGFLVGVLLYWLYEKQRKTTP